MENKLLNAAIEYNGMGFSVIPCKKNKKPFLKWTKYQTHRASQDQIKKWWAKWPDANPAIVTGKISDLIVVDADTDEGRENLNDNFLPDAISIPTVKTRNGGRQ